MFGRETFSYFRDATEAATSAAEAATSAANRIDQTGYDAQLILREIQGSTLAAFEDVAREWKTTAQVASIAIGVMALALVIGIGVSAMREWDR